MITRVAAIRRLGMGPVRSLPQIIREKLGDFIELMKHRVIFGECRYGDPRAGACDNWERSDCLQKLKEKVVAFELTRNHELLPDVANYAAFLYSFDDHPSAHFSQGDQENERPFRKKCRDIALSWVAPRN